MIRRERRGEEKMRELERNWKRIMGDREKKNKKKCLLVAKDQ